MPRDFDMGDDRFGNLLIKPLHPMAEAFLRDAVDPQARWTEDGALVVKWPFIQGVKRVIRNAGYTTRED